MATELPIATSKSVDSVTRLLYLHEVKGNPTPKNDDYFSRAYGKSVFDKIAGTLFDDSNVQYRRSALKMLSELWMNPINVIEAKHLELLKPLTQIVHSASDEPTRAFASRCLLYFTRNRICRKKTWADDAAIVIILNSIGDANFEVKLNSYLTIEELCRDRQGLAALSEQRLVSHLIEQSLVESHSKAILHILQCLAAAIAEKTGVITLIEVDKPLKSVLKHVDNELGEVRAAVGLCLTNLSRDSEGRQVALDSQAMFKIKAFFGDPLDSVRINAASSLMYLAIDLRGKSDLKSLGLVDYLIRCLGDLNELVVMFTLQTLTSIAEDMSGRMMLRTATTLASIEHVSHRPALMNTARRALTQIQWIP